MPLYVLGLNGVMRRTNHYENTMFQPYFITAAFGTALILIGIIAQLIQLYVSVKNRHALCDKTGDPWNGRTLEWTVSSPAPLYNFAITPTVSELDQFWVDKETPLTQDRQNPNTIHYAPIHMPKNTGAGFIIAICAGITGFALVWHMVIPGLVGFFGMLITIIHKSFDTDVDYYIDADTIKKTELAHLKESMQ
jgi:cytochrome o ubiquinol oxidase subunit 1